MAKTSRKGMIFESKRMATGRLGASKVWSLVFCASFPEASCCSNVEREVIFYRAYATHPIKAFGLTEL